MLVAEAERQADMLTQARLEGMAVQEEAVIVRSLVGLTKYTRQMAQEIREAVLAGLLELQGLEIKAAAVALYY